MKKIDAIIRPFELDAVKDMLCGPGIHGMTVTEVKVPKDREEHNGIFSRADQSMEFMPKLKIEIIASDCVAEETVSLIAGNTGINMEGGTMIFVSSIEDVIRIRTGEKGEEAIK